MDLLSEDHLYEEYTRRGRLEVEQLSHPLGHGQTAAIAVRTPKTAALCFDRVWSLSKHRVPEDIRFSGSSKAEQAISSLQDLWEDDLVDYLAKPSGDVFRKLSWIFESEILGVDVIEVAARIQQGNAQVAIERNLRRTYWSAYHQSVTPMYSSTPSFDRQYSPQLRGRRSLLLALHNLALVDEEALSWDQVREFRRDKRNQKLYRDFLYFWEDTLEHKSQSFIEDTIARKLERYDESLRKFDIRTVLGVLSEALDAKYLAGASAVTAALSLADQPYWGLVAGSGLIIGNVLIKAAERLIDLDDVEKGPDSEIAWIYEAGSKLRRKSRMEGNQ